MFPRIVGVKPRGEYLLELSFNDGTTGEVDLKERVVDRGGLFAALENLTFFQQVAVDQEAGTIFWPNGVDLCPDVLYSLVTGKPIPVLLQSV